MWFNVVILALVASVTARSTVPATCTYQDIDGICVPRHQCTSGISIPEPLCPTSDSFCCVSSLPDLGARSFDLSKQNNVVAYWGQGDGGDPALHDVCSEAAYDAIILSFITVIGEYKTPKLTSDYFTSGDIDYCHSKGKTMLLSIGGGGYNVYFESVADAQNAAKQVWDLFLGGTAGNRPYGSVVFDGIDLDIESGAPKYWANFTTALKSLYGSQSFYLSSAPQCPFSDAQMGPDGSVWNGQPIHGSAISEGWFDFLNLQFYNNPGCQVTDSGFNLGTWSKALKERTKNHDMKIMVGIPGSPSAAGTGYVSPNQIPVATLKSFSSFSGIMFWDVQAAEHNNNFQDQIKSILG